MVFYTWPCNKVGESVSANKICFSKMFGCVCKFLKFEGISKITDDSNKTGVFLLIVKMIVKMGICSALMLVVLSLISYACITPMMFSNSALSDLNKY